MMKKIIAIGCLILLNGCATYSGITANDRYLSAPQSPPNIITGQKAFLRGDFSGPIGIRAWQNTGLFSSVEQASSSTPPSDGVLIDNECREVRSTDRGLGGPFSLLTLFLVPVVSDEVHECVTRFYQNGLKLTETSYSFTYIRIAGWAALAYKDEDAIADAAAASVNAVLWNLNKKQ